MGVKDNLRKLKKAQQNKNAIGKIARKAVQQGKVEGDFLAEYNSFSVSLKEVLEKVLIIDGNKSITISSRDDKNMGNNVKYLNYVTEDSEYLSLYNMTTDIDANVTFSLKTIEDNDDSSLSEDEKSYQDEISYFLDN